MEGRREKNERGDDISEEPDTDEGLDDTSHARRRKGREEEQCELELELNRREKSR